jgi:hypothetical protein
LEPPEALPGSTFRRVSEQASFSKTEGLVVTLPPEPDTLARKGLPSCPAELTFGAILGASGLSGEILP